jgi:hypothetical protein
VKIFWTGYSKRCKRYCVLHLKNIVEFWCCAMQLGSWQVCEDWFTRLRPWQLRASAAVKCDIATVRVGMRQLSELRYQLTTAIQAADGRATTKKSSVKVWFRVQSVVLPLETNAFLLAAAARTMRESDSSAVASQYESCDCLLVCLISASAM